MGIMVFHYNTEDNFVIKINLIEMNVVVLFFCSTKKKKKLSKVNFVKTSDFY